MKTIVIIIILAPLILISNVRRGSLLFYPKNKSEIDIKQHFLIEFMLHRINSGKDFECKGFRLFLVSKKDSIELLLVDSVPTKGFTHFFLYVPYKPLCKGSIYSMIVYRPYFENKNEKWVDFVSSECLYIKKRYIKEKKYYKAQYDERERFVWTTKPLPRRSWFKFINSDGNMSKICFSTKFKYSNNCIFKVTFFDTLMKQLHVTYKLPEKNGKFSIREEFGYGDFIFECCKKYYIKIEVVEFGKTNPANSVDKILLNSPIPNDYKKYHSKKYKFQYK